MTYFHRVATITKGNQNNDKVEIASEQWGNDFIRNNEKKPTYYFEEMQQSQRRTEEC